VPGEKLENGRPGNQEKKLRNNQTTKLHEPTKTKNDRNKKRKKKKKKNVEKKNTVENNSPKKRNKHPKKNTLGQTNAKIIRETRKNGRVQNRETATQPPEKNGTRVNHTHKKKQFPKRKHGSPRTS
jgi:hypothetical protein